MLIIDDCNGIQWNAVHCRGAPSHVPGWGYYVPWCLFYDYDTIHAEKEWAEMYDFHMAALLVLTGHGIKARTHACAKITHFPPQCKEDWIELNCTRTWKALGLWPHASQALMMHLVGKCVISTWTWILAIWYFGISRIDSASMLYDLIEGPIVRFDMTMGARPATLLVIIYYILSHTSSD